LSKLIASVTSAVPPVVVFLSMIAPAVAFDGERIWSATPLAPAPAPLTSGPKIRLLLTVGVPLLRVNAARPLPVAPPL
jgi:hypothetical protein